MPNSSYIPGDLYEIIESPYLAEVALSGRTGRVSDDYEPHDIYVGLILDDGVRYPFARDEIKPAVNSKLVDLSARWPAGTRVSYGDATGTVVLADGYLAEKGRRSGTEYGTVIDRSFDHVSILYVCVRFDDGYLNAIGESALTRLDPEPVDPVLDNLLNLVGTAYNVLLDANHPDAAAISEALPAIADRLGRPEAGTFDLRYRTLDGSKIGW